MNNRPDCKAGEYKARILVVDDEAVVGTSCRRILSAEGYFVEAVQSPGTGLEKAASENYDLILIDLVMPDLDGLSLLNKIKESGVSSEVIIMTAYATVETAVEAMKGGAVDYICKPFSPVELSVVVERTIERSTLLRENLALRRELKLQQGFEGMIGQSRPMQQVFGMIKRVAPSQCTVLITGESGSGKEMVARAIHRLSPRQANAFLACDCSSLTPTLLESEIFGHVKGSFSGAIVTKQGLFEVAHRGTLFLDEVANLSLDIQGKLLRVLETRRIKKVGDTEEHEIDIRLIVATNRDLFQLVRSGSFREDLYYRLNVLPIYLPPLRERREDITPLAVLFLSQIRDRDNIKVRSFTPEALKVMENYSWPGNVRELKNLVERTAVLCDTDQVEVRHLPAELRDPLCLPMYSDLPQNWEEFKRVKQELRERAVSELERRFLSEALQRSGGNITRAAEDVGMQRTNFHSLMRKHHLSSEDIEPTGEQN